ncbi:MAG: N polyprotein [Apis rhabdovirus 2]|nr:N protein [Apis rhabdovirus 2]UCR92656.1 N protein [Apis rhabdovirus 2]UCR92661.1 N protein [Apis rhabdovirus 2]WAK79930.1 MAG: N polyprotein [Apis rhabdovirus 2]WAK79935.1 MAG: N polyprotein [Apis rhabdovirus 2]
MASRSDIERIVQSRQCARAAKSKGERNSLMPNLNLVQDIKNTPKYADVSVSSIARSLNNVTDGSKVPRMLNDCMALLLGAKWNLPRELRGYLNIPPQKDPRLYEIAHLMGGREPDGQLIEVSQSQDEDLDVLSAFETAEGEEQGDTIIILFLWMLVAQGHKKATSILATEGGSDGRSLSSTIAQVGKLGTLPRIPNRILKLMAMSAGNSSSVDSFILELGRIVIFFAEHRAFADLDPITRVASTLTNPLWGWCGPSKSVALLSTIKEFEYTHEVFVDEIPSMYAFNSSRCALEAYISYDEWESKSLTDDKSVWRVYLGCMYDQSVLPGLRGRSGKTLKNALILARAKLDEAAGKEGEVTRVKEGLQKNSSTPINLESSQIAALVFAAAANKATYDPTLLTPEEFARVQEEGALFAAAAPPTFSRAEPPILPENVKLPSDDSDDDQESL